MGLTEPAILIRTSLFYSYYEIDTSNAKYFSGSIYSNNNYNYNFRILGLQDLQRLFSFRSATGRSIR